MLPSSRRLPSDGAELRDLEKKRYVPHFTMTGSTRVTNKLLGMTYSEYWSLAALK